MSDDNPDHERKCPNCGAEVIRDEVDNGVGIQCGPACDECGWTESDVLLGEPHPAPTETDEEAARDWYATNPPEVQSCPTMFAGDAIAIYAAGIAHGRARGEAVWKHDRNGLLDRVVAVERALGNDVDLCPGEYALRDADALGEQAASIRAERDALREALNDFAVAWYCARRLGDMEGEYHLACALLASLTPREPTPPTDLEHAFRYTPTGKPPLSRASREPDPTAGPPTETPERRWRANRDERDGETSVYFGNIAHAFVWLSVEDGGDTCVVLRSNRSDGTDPESTETDMEGLGKTLFEALDWLMAAHQKGETDGET